MPGMKSRHGRTLSAHFGMALAIAVGLGAGLPQPGSVIVPPSDDAVEQAARTAIKPAAPLLPAEIVSALQEGKNDVARAALIKHRESIKDGDDRAYLGYLQGIAERLGGRKDEARATLRAAALESPKGRWVPKIQFELAGLELAAGNLAVAEELARSEATRLLADTERTAWPRSIMPLPAS